ncbi:hypothetical protein CgunFtcFv8_010003 [Champsocephalus gunnari]|uniref:Uncharacterized protein n=1 Tax=Champsocephalus gunnari TaxID=52237 RepID=A0AAN8C772_CHAGU|nr:hypothetical protein CgunFtcFv8_010003 [Champsocephalus gunnari]
MGFLISTDPPPIRPTPDQTHPRSDPPPIRPTPDRPAGPDPLHHVFSGLTSDPSTLMELQLRVAHTTSRRSHRRCLR